MSAEPKRRYISKAEFATYLGVHRSQVTKAVQSGRIRETPSGRIDWRVAQEDWEDNRSDSLSGSGRANNAKSRKVKALQMDGVPTIPKIKGMEQMEEVDVDDGPPAEVINPEDVGRPPKRNTRAYEEYRERKAKAEWAEIRVRKQKGELLERNDVIAVYGATLNGLKTGILSLPQRTSMKVMGNIKEWLAANGLQVDANKYVFLEKLIEQTVMGEAHFVLTDIIHKINNVTQEADNLAEKVR